MTISFPVRDAVAHPDRYIPRGIGFSFTGLLVISADAATLHDWQTDDRLELDPTGSWRNWLPQRIPPLTGEYEYFDEGTVAGFIKVEEERVLLYRLWAVSIQRDGKSFHAEHHD